MHRPLSAFPRQPYHIQNNRTNGSASQQVVLSDPCLSNPCSIVSDLNHRLPSLPSGYHNSLAPEKSFHVQSQLHTFSPQFPVQFDNSSIHSINFSGNAIAMPNRPPLTPPSCIPNIPPHPFLLQNNHLGVPLLGLSAPQHLTQPQGQFCSQNTPQIVNPFATYSLPRGFCNLPQSLNQTAPTLLHGQFLHNHPLFMNQTVPLQPDLSASGPNGPFCSHQRPQHFKQITGSTHGLFYQQNPMQNMNNFMPMQCPEHPVDPTQSGPYNVHPCPGFLTGSSNQVAQTVDSQKTTFRMNSQSKVVYSNGAAQQSNQDHHTFIQPALGPNALQDSHIASQTLQGSNDLPSHNYGSIQMQQTQMNMQPPGFQHPQGIHAKDVGNATINTNWRNPQIKNCSKSHDSGMRERFDSRFQKSQFHPVVNAKGNLKSFKWKERKVNSHRGVKNHIDYAAKRDKVECKRSLALNYTEQEIQQWREARRKNYPTESNIEKKFSEKQTDPGAVDRDSKTWRQQLKEILARQAELGVEVAEIPQDYLSDSEKQVCEDKKVWSKKGRIQNKHGNRESHIQDNRFAKKQRINGDRGSLEMPVVKRKPTLLQKLLTGDIKRDKSHLLQAFRFMLKNSFFKDWPDKKLEFPSITVTNMGFESQVAGESSPQEGNDGVSDVPGNNMVVGFVGPRHHSTADDKNKGCSDDVEDDAEVEEMVYRGAGETRTREEIEKSEDEEGEIID